jgi:hypothetical protein
MEAIRFSETLVHTKFTWRHIPEDSILHSHWYENLKFYNEHALCWTSDVPRLFCSWWLWALPLQQLLLCFWVIIVNPNFVTVMIREIQVKVEFSLTFSCSSRHTFTRRCFWLFVKSWETNSAAMWCMFKFSVNISWQTS